MNYNFRIYSVQVKRYSFSIISELDVNLKDTLNFHGTLNKCAVVLFWIWCPPCSTNTSGRKYSRRTESIITHVSDSGSLSGVNIATKRSISGGYWVTTVN